MSKALMLAAPYAVELIKESLQICNNIMQYRHAAIQVEVQRESMHRQADLALLKQRNKHELKMQKMKQLSANFGLVLEHNRLSADDTMQLYHSANDRANQILACLSQPEHPHEIKAYLAEVMMLINTELLQLSKDHYGIAGQSLTAYMQNCDDMRGRPSTYTDVC